MVPQDDVLGDGQPQTVAAPLGVGGVGAVEPLEDVFQILLGNFRPRIGHRQAAPAAGAGKGDGDVPRRFRVLPGIVQENVRRLPQVLLAAPEGDARLDIRCQGQACLEEHRLEGENRIADQLAEIHLGEDQISLAAVGPGQVQHLFNELAHLPGHGEDVDGELAAAFLVEIRAVQKLCVGHDDRQRGFQLVRGVRHKLPLLLPRLFHRLYRPPGQQPADEEKHGEAQCPDEKTGLDEVGEGCLFAGHIRKGDALPVGGDTAAVPQTVIRKDPYPVPGAVHIGNQGLQIVLVGEVVVPHSRGHVSRLVQVQHKKGQLHPIRRISGPFGPKGSGRHRLEHGHALGLQVLPGEVVHQGEDTGQHHRDDQHVDADELQPQLPDHSATSRW